ncbi:MAG: hypothetical protein ACJAWV_002177 [Flammeovirgaceae bacterium]|jgi:uncharacterized protein (TIGR03032 family)
MSEHVPAPFSCTHSPNFPDFLQKMDCTILISTYQAGKVVLISAKDENNLVQLPRTFKKPMGIAIDKSQQRMAIATKDEVIVTANSKELAQTYPNKQGIYDALFMPRATYYTGLVDMHDLHFGENGTIWGINTVLGAICLIDSECSFKPVWTPPFISEMVAEDRCHLNGLAMKDGKPKYVTALGSGDKAGSWRDGIASGGIVMDVETNEIIAEGLGMPHSPRLYEDGLYVALSAEERIIRIDPVTHEQTTVAKSEGFIRGMSRIGDYLFVGKSKLRKNSSTFSKLEIADRATEAGIDMIHIPTGATMSKLQYLASVDEIYDVQILKGMKRPNLLNTHTDLHKYALVTPDSTFWADPEAMKEKQ